MGEMSPILVTGAAGFLGCRIVAAARTAGIPVRAVLRDAARAPAGWGADPGVIVLEQDLSTSEAGAALEPMLAGAGAVIHAAAGQGGEAAHARDTLAPTEALIEAMRRTGQGGRLVLVSSFSVYGYAALPSGAVLDETAPREPDPARRDAYTCAKLAQEALAIRAAQTGGLAVRLIRPGAIYGPGRVVSARLGYGLAGRMLCPGGDAPVPAIHVDRVAEGLVAAATRPMDWPDDFPVIEGGGRLDIVNLVDPDPPTQADWLAAIGQGRVIRLPLGPILKLARALDLAADLWPALDRALPTGAREAGLAARFKPLAYSTARAEDRLGLAPARGFAATMAESLAEETP